MSSRRMECPRSGIKRTSRSHRIVSAYDLKADIWPAVSANGNVECVHVRDGHTAMLPAVVTMLESSCHLATSRDDLRISAWMILIAESACTILPWANCSRGDSH